jgi:hypothetical protein
LCRYNSVAVLKDMLDGIDPLANPGAVHGRCLSLDFTRPTFLSRISAVLIVYLYYHY